MKEGIKKKNTIFVQINKMAKRNDIGRDGESAAREYLEKKGYLISQMNWHWHHYELDIIAIKDNELIVVEVKTRSATFLISPEEAVDKAKIRRIATAADAYARYFRIGMPIRFDIITLIKHGDTYEIDHIDDAFYAPCR